MREEGGELDAEVGERGGAGPRGHEQERRRRRKGVALARRGVENGSDCRKKRTEVLD